MNENLIETITEVTDANTQRIARLEEDMADFKKALQQMADWSVAAQNLSKSNSAVNLLNAQIAGMAKDNQSLRNVLQGTKDLLSKPQQHKHSHYFPKIAWVTAGLFLALCLVSIGWYSTTSRLDASRTNDLKYRYLRLVDQAAIVRTIRQADSLHQAKPDFFRDSVNAAEIAKQERLEMLDEAIQKEKEARDLRQKASNK